MALRFKLGGAVLQCAALAATSLIACFGCTQVVDVESYAFDRSPCGVRPPSCDGGEERVYIVVQSDIARADAMRQLDGFDLDATGDPICGQQDFVSPRGERGIDNQLTNVLTAYESLMMLDLREMNRLDYIAGRNLFLIIVSDIDDPLNDDCVQLSFRGARLPPGVSADTLDQLGGPDGEIDPGLTFDYLPAIVRDPTACIIDGEVYGRFASGALEVPGLGNEATFDRGRARLRLDEARIEEAVLGGALRLDEISRAVPAEVAEFLQGRADIAPSARTSDDCQSISFAVHMDAVPAVRGSSI